MLSTLVSALGPASHAGDPLKEGREGMKCPHCQMEYTGTPHSFALGEDQDGVWSVSSDRCPTCDRIIVTLGTAAGSSYPVWPQFSERARPAQEVPTDFAAEYQVASQVLHHSPEASAALSRRLLHRFLSTQSCAGFGSLLDQIRQLVRCADMPAYLKQALETLVRVGKLEANPLKSQHPAALMAVEPGEAEWNLDVLETLFDFYFIQPIRLQKKLDAVEEKLAAIAAAKAEAEAALEAEAAALAAEAAAALEAAELLESQENEAVEPAVETGSTAEPPAAN